MEVYLSNLLALKSTLKIMLMRISLIPNQILPKKANVLHLLLLLNHNFLELKTEQNGNKMIFTLNSQLKVVPSQFNIKIKFHKINTLKQL